MRRTIYDFCKQEIINTEKQKLIKSEKAIPFRNFLIQNIIRSKSPDKELLSSNPEEDKAAIRIPIKRYNDYGQKLRWSRDSEDRVSSLNLSRSNSKALITEESIRVK